MYVLAVHVALIGFLDARPYPAETAESMAGLMDPHLGTWRVRDIIDGPASPRGDKKGIKNLRVRITGKRLVVTGGEEKEDYVIVGIQPARGTATIDLRDRTGRIYRGIYERKGKRLRICVQFW